MNGILNLEKSVSLRNDKNSLNDPIRSGIRRKNLRDLGVFLLFITKMLKL